MIYTDIAWRHDHADEPIRLLSELDNDRMERRKVEIFKDGSMGYAGPDGHFLSELGLAPVPHLRDLDDEEFTGKEIEAMEFDDVWVRAISKS